jgi:hypothetical protein
MKLVQNISNDQATLVVVVVMIYRAGRSLHGHRLAKLVRKISNDLADPDGGGGVADLSGRQVTRHALCEQSVICTSPLTAVSWQCPLDTGHHRLLRRAPELCPMCNLQTQI